MTPAELRADCERAIAWAAKNHTPPGLQLVVSRPAGGRRMRVMPGVMGEVCCESVDAAGKPQTVVIVDPVKVLRALDAAERAEKAAQTERKR